MTNANILEKRAEICEFYERQNALSGQQIRQNLRNQQNQRNSINPKICEFCGRRGHEMRVCHAFTRQQSQNHQVQDTYMQTSNLQNQNYIPNPHLKHQNLSQRYQDQRPSHYQAAMIQKKCSL